MSFKHVAILLLLTSALTFTPTASADCLSDVKGCVNGVKEVPGNLVDQCTPATDCARLVLDLADAAGTIVLNLAEYVVCTFVVNC